MQKTPEPPWVLGSATNGSAVFLAEPGWPGEEGPPTVPVHRRTCNGFPIVAFPPPGSLHFHGERPAPTAATPRPAPARAAPARTARRARRARQPPDVRRAADQHDGRRGHQPGGDGARGG